MRTATVRRGDIFYVIDTGATGSEQAGDRPAVIVSNDAGNRYAPVVEAVYLTTRTKASLPTHVFIGSAERPSMALCEQIVTVCKSRLERYVGHTTEEEMRGIDEALQKSLGIHTTGGKAMKITMTTPFGEMKLDIPPEKATDLMQRAFQYATGQETIKETQELHTSPLAPGKPVLDGMNVEQDDTPEAVVLPQARKPQSRVERMFGNFRASSEATQQVPEPQKVQEPYKGFLIIKCQHCGEIKAFCAKTPITRHTCKCGATTEFHDLKMLHLKCKCGSTFNYRTNITDQRIEWPCLNCGSPVDLELNKRGTAYVTIT